MKHDRHTVNKYFFIEVIDSNGSSKEYPCCPLITKTPLSQCRIFTSVSTTTALFLQLEHPSKKWIIADILEKTHRHSMLKYISGRMFLHDLLRSVPVHNCISKVARKPTDIQTTLHISNKNISPEDILDQVPNVHNLEIEMHPFFTDTFETLSKVTIMRNLLYIFASLPNETPLIKLYELYKRLEIYTSKMQGFNTNYANEMYYEIISDRILNLEKPKMSAQLKNFVFANLQNQAKGTTI